MSTALNIFYGLLIGFTLSMAFQLKLKVNDLQTQVNSFESGIKQSNEVILDITRGQVNAVQDSIEERLGNLERSVSDIEFLMGKKQ